MPALINSILTETISSGLFVDEVVHGMVAAPFAAFLIYKTQSIKRLTLFFITMYLIDLDHFIDFWLITGFNLDLLEFFKLDYFDMSGKAIIFLHAWEWVLVAGVIAYKRGWKSYFTLIAMALLAHIIWDAIGLNSAPFYSIIYRSTHNFTLP